MVSDNKYYTPTLEEFHVGFRFELNLSVPDPDVIGKDAYWAKTVIDCPSQFNAITSETIRVKYLDQDDLEELGWEVKILDFGQDTKPYPDLLRDGVSYGHFYEGEDNLFMSGGYNIELFGKCFDVKNYNEMKKLMQMLRIK